nr:putative ACR [uncultured bacterium]
MNSKMLMIFCDETDLWENGERLYEAIVRRLHREGILGATVIGGMMGYGVHRRIHKKGLLGISDERPILILAIDSEERLRSVLPTILPMVKEGVVNLVDTEMLSAGPSRSILEGKEGLG